MFNENLDDGLFHLSLIIKPDFTQALQKLTSMETIPQVFNSAFLHQPEMVSANKVQLLVDLKCMSWECISRPQCFQWTC